MKEKLHYFDGFRRFKREIEGKDQWYIYPISLFHRSLALYNRELELEQVILFEHLLLIYRLHKLKPFYQQQKRMMKDLKIKRQRLEKAINYLKKLGILNVEPSHTIDRKIRYSLNLDKILESITILYELPEDPAERKSMVDELASFFRYFLSKRFLADEIDMSLPEEAYTGRFSIASKDQEDSISR